MTSAIRRALAARSLICASVTVPSLGGHRPALEDLFRMQVRDWLPGRLTHRMAFGVMCRPGPAGASASPPESLQRPGPRYGTICLDLGRSLPGGTLAVRR